MFNFEANALTNHFSVDNPFLPNNPRHLFVLRRE
jgi:hypothetical protein